ncbi:hypothetical protein Tco_1468388 [Tanacetum coccineum]
MVQFMNTKIYIDNESTFVIVKNPMFYSKTKHIEIRNHFIRDSYRKRLLQVIKIHTDHNVANLLIKAFDVSSAADNTHRSFVWGKAVWNYVYKYRGLYIMDVSNKGAKSASDENRFNSGLELKDKKELAIPGQTTTGKEFSNPLMAGCLPKILLLQKLVMLRTDLLFDDEDGITFLTNDDIFENLALMGSKIVLEKPNEPPLTEGHTSGSKDGSMKHTFELMDTVPPTISYFTLSHVRLPTPGVMRDQVRILVKDKGFGQEMHQSEEPKALYDVTSPKDCAVTYSNEEMSHHTLYGVNYLQDYAATFKYTRDDVSDSALRRNICDRVTP